MAAQTQTSKNTSHTYQALTQDYEMLSALKQSHVHIKHFTRVQEKINQLVTAGSHKLQVVADFDDTVSRYHLKGEKCQTTHSIVGESTLMPSWCRDKIAELYKHYYVIEVDPELSIAEKTPYMIEWWSKTHDAFIEAKLERSMLEQMVSLSRTHLRDNTSEMFSSLTSASVPLMVFSAGIGDIIQIVLERQKLLTSNIHIVSNFIDFNNQGVITGFKGDIIHAFNKNETAVQHSDYFKSLSSRDHVLLLGDSLGDLHMCDGMKNIKTLLTIGFLNDRIAERRNEFMEAFDIVLEDDQTMDIPNSIIQNILKSK